MPAAAPCLVYERHRPELTTLHFIVREHLETFLACVREERSAELPRYVVQELRRYVRCGILAHGFLRVVSPNEPFMSVRPPTTSIVTLSFPQEISARSPAPPSPGSAMTLQAGV